MQEGRRLNYIYWCTVKRYGILKVKNVLLKSLCYVTKSTVFGPVITETVCVYCAVRTESLCTVGVNHSACRPDEL